jgi:hypothetical protein
MRHLALLLLLAACAPDPPKPPPPKVLAKPVAPENIYPVYGVAVAKDGLLLTDPKTKEAKPAVFGMRQSLIIAILARSLGPADEGRDSDCGKDFARWGGDAALTLWFAQGAFTGWTLTGDPAKVGLAPGMARTPAMTGGAVCG